MISPSFVLRNLLFQQAYLVCSRTAVAPKFCSSLRSHSTKQKDGLDPLTVEALSGIPKSQLGRKATIENYGRSATQSGRDYDYLYKINFQSSDRWANPLMGWTSSG